MLLGAAISSFGFDHAVFVVNYPAQVYIIISIFLAEYSAHEITNNITFSCLYGLQTVCNGVVVSSPYAGINFCTDCCYCYSMHISPFFRNYTIISMYTAGKNLRNFLLIVLACLVASIFIPSKVFNLNSFSFKTNSKISWPNNFGKNMNLCVLFSLPCNIRVGEMSSLGKLFFYILVFKLRVLQSCVREA